MINALYSVALSLDGTAHSKQSVRHEHLVADENCHRLRLSKKGTGIQNYETIQVRQYSEDVNQAIICKWQDFIITFGLINVMKTQSGYIS